KLKYHLPNEFLLCVGTVETRKNQILILKALQLLPKNIHLLLVGKTTPYRNILNNFIELHRLQSRVQFLENISFSDLPAIYQLAKIFVYPSKFEGFGIPILEALNSGVPVIATTGSCLEEAGGPDSLYIHPDDDSGLSSTILRLWTNETLRNQIIEKGKRFALSFREDKVAAHLMRVYQKIIENA
nr:glycosyltransferase family 4 protein [Pseudopedobacter sp.]